MNRRVLNTKTLLMLRSFWCESKVRMWMGRGRVTALCLMAAAFVAVPRASAQPDFSMTVGANLSPNAVAPGGSAAAAISIVTGSGFVGPVTLGCTVTPSVGGTVSNPVCTVSPSSMSASGQSTATITTTETTTTVSYGITITATDASGTVTGPTLDLTVLSVSAQFTITVSSAVSPNSVPAGSGAEGTIAINPVNNYRTPSSGGITLYCASMTPLVTVPPYCSFSSGAGSGAPVIVTGSNPVAATVTVGTVGTTTQQCANPRWQHVYALWLGLPMLSLVGLGAGVGGKRSRKAWLLVGIFVVGAVFCMMPSCSNTTNVTCTNKGVTPAGTYTFTIVGVDGNGVASSNTASTGTAGPSVNLTVTAPVP
jgi:hypothetical protein